MHWRAFQPSNQHPGSFSTFNGSSDIKIAKQESQQLVNRRMHEENTKTDAVVVITVGECDSLSLRTDIDCDLKSSGEHVSVLFNDPKT